MIHTYSYVRARSTVDTIFGQKFHPSFPRRVRSCEHESGCGHFPTSSELGYGNGVALVLEDGEEEVLRTLNYLPFFKLHKFTTLYNYCKLSPSVCNSFILLANE